MTAPSPDTIERRRLRNRRRRVDRLRASAKTCITGPADRHLHIMADALATGGPYPMFQEEPEHCAETMLVVLESLWKSRKQFGWPK